MAVLLAAAELDEQGFTIIPGPVPPEGMGTLAQAYDATCFVPGSHRLEATPDQRADHAQPELACGDAGSLVVFNGSTWHGHTANTSSQPRRSIQGFFIPRDGQAGTDFAARMSPETRARLSPLAHHVLAL